MFTPKAPLNKHAGRLSLASANMAFGLVFTAARRWEETNRSGPAAHRHAPFLPVAGEARSVSVRRGGPVHA
jgi:hypothetical protein